MIEAPSHPKLARRSASSFFSRGSHSHETSEKRLKRQLDVVREEYSRRSVEEKYRNDLPMQNNVRLGNKNVELIAELMENRQVVAELRAKIAALERELCLLRDTRSSDRMTFGLGR